MKEIGYVLTGSIQFCHAKKTDFNQDNEKKANWIIKTEFEHHIQYWWVSIVNCSILYKHVDVDPVWFFTTENLLGPASCNSESYNDSSEKWSKFPSCFGAGGL